MRVKSQQRWSSGTIEDIEKGIYFADNSVNSKLLVTDNYRDHDLPPFSDILTSA